MKTTTRVSTKFYSPEQFRNLFWGMNTFWIIIVIILIILGKCSSDGKINHLKDDYYKLVRMAVNERNRLNDSIANLNDSIDMLNEGLNIKAIIYAQRVSGGYNVYAQIVPMADSGKSELFLPDRVITRSVFKYLEFPEGPVSRFNDKVLDCFNPVCMDTINSRLHVYLGRAWKDSTSALFYANLSFKKLCSLQDYQDGYAYNFLEYTKNKYSDLEEKSFRWGIIFAAAATGLYATSEAVGHPKYWDNQDNLDASRKSHLIKGLRTGSTILGIASALEFGRTIYFHKKNKLYISPTTISLKLSLDKK